MQPGHFLKLINLFSFVVNEHLEEQGFPLFADKLVHGLIDFDSVLDCVLGRFDQTHFCLVLLLVLLLLPQIIQLFDRDALFFNAFLPNFHFLFLRLLLSLSFPLLFLHSENLC